MCGIAGILTVGRVDEAVLSAMGKTLAHRGPDDHGVWVDHDAGIGLAHRRLSIVDLTSSGHQPMISPGGRCVLSFNGEIYNHAQIRRSLEAEGNAPEGGWLGHSDTEVLLQAIETYGLDRALSLAVGMFAISLWDRQSRQLHLVRDRFGEKPLYYGWAGKTFLFGSELKALRKHPDFIAEVDRQSLATFASLGVVPAPRSIFRHVFKLEPGCILTLTRDASAHRWHEAPTDGDCRDGLELRRYWNFRELVEQGHAKPITDRNEAANALEEALARSVADQLVADVPVGAFLSGGIDSSTIVALAQRASSQPVRTYTVGFAEQQFDEAPYARQIAKYLGTDHNELILGAGDALAIIPELPGIYDEPFADSSQIPVSMVSRFARRDVTVALSGDGGDELFAGYNRHNLVPRMSELLRRVPSPFRRFGGGLAGAMPEALWANLSFLGLKGPDASRKVRKGIRIASRSNGLDELHFSFLDEWWDYPPVACAALFHWTAPPIDENIPEVTKLSYWDTITYLPDDILTKVDRAAMAAGLETRVPMLDHRVSAVAARIPPNFKVDRGGGKSVLKDVLARHVPRSMFKRPKTGFGMPIGDWLRGPLREWAESLLDNRRLAETGWFNPGIVRRRWTDHLAGGASTAAGLWHVLMFMAWVEQG